MRELRKSRGMTQAEAAEAAGLSDKAYANIERGEADMHISTLVSLCNAFHASPSDIIGEPEDQLIEDTQQLIAELEKLSTLERRRILRLLSVLVHQSK